MSEADEAGSKIGPGMRARMQGLEKVAANWRIPFFNSSNSSPRSPRTRATSAPAPGSSPEQTLEALLDQERGLRRSRQPQIAAQLADLLEEMPREAVPRCRALLDAGLLFRQKDGSFADLRSFVFECDLDAEQKQRILSRLKATCPSPGREQRGFVVLTDVDDTLLPGHDALHLAGSDRSWHLDGRLYPGVSCLHRELRAGLRDAYGPDYSVLLTARPPSLLRSLVPKFKRLTGVKMPRMAILPGEGGPQTALNALRVLAGNYGRLGETKVSRMKEYAMLFEEYSGRFVFIGDDGQADLEAAEQMLALKPNMLERASEQQTSREASREREERSSSSDESFVLAFVAIKSCYKNEKEDEVAKQAREGTVLRLRDKYRPVPEEQAAIKGLPGATPHRFFYFDDYLDLAEQLGAAGWLSPEQRDSVQKAVMRDSMPSPEEMVRNCDLEGLETALEAKKQNNIEEADEAEMEAFVKAQTALPMVAAAHLHIGEPPRGAQALAFKATSMRLKDVEWIGGGSSVDEQMQPRFVVWDTSAKASSNTSWEVCGGDEERLPWPCEALARRGARPALDVSLGPHVGRCYILAKNEPPYAKLHHSASASASVGQSGGEARDGEDPHLLSAVLIGFDSSGPDPSACAGQVEIRVKWIVTPPGIEEEG